MEISSSFEKKETKSGADTISVVSAQRKSTWGSKRCGAVGKTVT